MHVTIGPIDAKYLSVAPVRGAVIGGFGKGSNGLHRLIKDIAKAAGQKLYAQLLGLSPEAAAALAKARLTRSVGTAMARGHAQMLLARLPLAVPLAAQRAVNRLRRQGHVLDMRSLEMETRAVLRGRGC